MLEKRLRASKQQLTKYNLHCTTSTSGCRTAQIITYWRVRPSSIFSRVIGVIRPVVYNFGKLYTNNTFVKKELKIWARGDQDISLLTVVGPNQWLSCLSQTQAYLSTHVTLHSKYKTASPANTKQSFFNFFAEKFSVPREVTITRHVPTLMPNLRSSHLQIFGHLAR